MKQTSFGHQQLCMSYHTVKICGIAPTMMSLLSCKEPDGGPLLCFQNVHLSTPDLNRWVTRGININTYLFILNFGVYFIYI